MGCGCPTTDEKEVTDVCNEDGVHVSQLEKLDPAADDYSCHKIYTEKCSDNCGDSTCEGKYTTIEDIRKNNDVCFTERDPDSCDDDGVGEDQGLPIEKAEYVKAGEQDSNGNRLSSTKDFIVLTQKRLATTRTGSSVLLPDDNIMNMDVSANTPDINDTDTWYQGASQSIVVKNDTCEKMCGTFFVDVPYDYSMAGGTFARRNIQFRLNGGTWSDFKRRGEQHAGDWFSSEDMDQAFDICLPAKTDQTYEFRMILGIESSGGTNTWIKHGIGLRYHITTENY